ncbi:MAG: hypothetical protein ABEJ70_01360 [Halobacteriaceae archaeon]
MSASTDRPDETEWVEMRGIARIIGLWIVALVVAIALLFVLNATVF